MKKVFFTVILLCFVVTSIMGPSPVYAQDIRLPAPGVMVPLSPEFKPPILKGIKVHPDNPFRFDFILDRGDSQLSNDALKDESSKLIKYFLVSLTIPAKDLWVNLSPYEKNRIVPESFGQTAMGRDLLAEDYMLKQITASLIYPEGEIGKKFWKRIYQVAAKKFGTTNIPVNTFNKVWIVPEKAVVYENAKAGTAYVVESKLKVMLEQDYLSLEKHEGLSEQFQIKDTNQLGSQIVREIVIPQLTKEVNEDKNFFQLRQIYSSLILATWYKKKIKDSILEQVYVDKNKVAGVSIDDPKEKERIYERYLQAFKKGAYNYIKDEIDPFTQQLMPRKYFSGGVDETDLDSAMIFRTVSSIPNTIFMNSNGDMHVTADLAMASDFGKEITEAFRNAIMEANRVNKTTLKEVIEILQNRSSDDRRTFEISDLQSISGRLEDIRKLLNFDFEVSLEYTDEGKWFLISGQKNETSTPPFIRNLFIQGRILIDIHTHPRSGELLSIAGHDEYPSLGDLGFYFLFGNHSIILSQNGISFISRPTKNPITGEDLKIPGYDLNFLQWYNQHFGTNLQGILEATSENFLELLMLAGVNFQFVPWNDLETIKILDEHLNPALTYNPLEKLSSSNESSRSQAESFLEKRYRAAGGEIDNHGNKPRSVPLQTLMQYFPRSLSTHDVMQVIDLYNKSKPPETRIKIDAAMIRTDVLPTEIIGHVGPLSKIGLEAAAVLETYAHHANQYGGLPLIVVDGPSGIGKTSIVNEMIDVASRVNRQVLVLSFDIFMKPRDWRYKQMDAILSGQLKSEDFDETITWDIEKIKNLLTQIVNFKKSGKLRKVLNIPGAWNHEKKIYENLKFKITDKTIFVIDWKYAHLKEVRPYYGEHPFLLRIEDSDENVRKRYIEREEGSGKRTVADLEKLEKLYDLVFVPSYKRYKKDVEGLKILRLSEDDDYAMMVRGPDKAMITPMNVKKDVNNTRNLGGIDLTSDKALLVQNSGQGIKFHIDPAMFQQLQNAPGFVPIIINIQPMNNLRDFLEISG